MDRGPSARGAGGPRLPRAVHPAAVLEVLRKVYGMSGLADELEGRVGS